MSTAGHTPNFIAESAIYPFRCVKVGSVPFKAVPSTSNPEVLLGVTDGSVQGFKSVYHATPGQPISLQNGEFVQLTAGGTIAVGDTLIATTNGKVIADTASTEYIAQAVDNASDGEVFWAKKIGAWTVHGGGGGTVTIDVQEFDDPEAMNSWEKPAGAMTVMVQLCGAGQDGGDAFEFPAYGGNGGTIAQKEFDATDLPSTVSVTLGIHQPFATASEDGTSAFGTYVYAPMAAYSGPIGADSGGSNLQVCGSGMPGYFRFGQGSEEDMGTNHGGNQGAPFGPGGGGGGFDLPGSGNGGKASTGSSIEYGSAMVVQPSGGGAEGISDGIGPGGNGGNGSIDPVTGFGSGGGAGGYGGPLEDGGNGGNGVRGGGGGSAGIAGSGGNPGLPGQGGDGYVRVTTICFN